MNEDEDKKWNITAKLGHTLGQTQETCQQPTWQEIGCAIQRMRNNRAPGEDTIVA